MRIGEIAAAAGVRVDTVRYYERRGLLAAPARSPSGYRAFGPEAVDRIRFIKRAQELGFTLEEIDGLLRLHAERETQCAQVRDIAEHKRADLDERIADLRRIRGALQVLIESCDGDAALAACPLLECLAGAAEGDARGEAR